MERNSLSEAVLKEAASLYVAREGEALLRELELPFDVKLDMRGRVTQRIRLDRVKTAIFIAGPIAACLIAALFLSRFLDFNSGNAADMAQAPMTITEQPAIPAAETPAEPTAPASEPLPAAPQTPPEPKRAEITLLSSKLPEGCVLTKTDYDHDKTIYYIINDTGNEIVLVTEPRTQELDTRGFREVDISGTTGYLLSKRDYKTLITQTDDMRLTLTSRYGAGDLYAVARAVI